VEVADGSRTGNFHALRHGGDVVVIFAGCLIVSSHDDDTYY
jgi:hypothetical protein